MAQCLHLVCVGKLKEKSLQDIESEYFKRLRSPTLKIHELKSRNEDTQKEGQEILDKIHHLKKDDPQAKVIALCEEGIERDTEDFSNWLEASLLNSSPIFIIAGAAGHDQKVLKSADEKLSLSKLTFPHKLARILLIEQLYRAQTLRERHPYHK
jgi:23S rRNA (pseudouridine1915-N3)-methyltransferase